MTNILITGGNGYLANALYEALHINYSVTTVNRDDFDLSNTLQANQWLSDKHFDIVIHTAIKGGHRLIKDTASVLDTNLKMYYNLLDNKQHYGKFINIGSGAEVYQTNSPYGLSKRIIRESLLDKNNFYNIRAYGLFDENEMDTRFIKASTVKYIQNKPIEITQDKLMDFFYMKDFIKVVQYYIDNNDTPKEFDCCYEESLYLSQIANKINNLSEHKVAINVMNENFADNYVGTNIPIDIKFIGMDAGIKLVYEKLLCKK
jgi:nucleoside-diphosphate-sugar epimerase